MTKIDIDKLIRGIKSIDAMTFEDAFHTILPFVDEYRIELLDAMHKEPDKKIRARFIELLGHSTDEGLIPTFKKELDSQHDDTVSWCLFALEENPSIEGKKIANDFRKKIQSIQFEKAEGTP